MASSVDLNAIGPRGSGTDPLRNHTSHAWLIDIGAMVLLLLFFYSALTWWRLLKLGPPKRGA